MALTKHVACDPGNCQQYRLPDLQAVRLLWDLRGYYFRILGPPSRAMLC